MKKYLKCLAALFASLILMLNLAACSGEKKEESALKSENTSEINSSSEKETTSSSEQEITEDQGHSEGFSEGD